MIDADGDSTLLVIRVIDASKSSRFIDVYSVRLTLPQMVVSHAHLIVTSQDPLPPEKYPQNMGAIDVVDVPKRTQSNNESSL
ncbi:hypothetical protein [Nostoc sp. WHI]|uniref:hypothetical protein n=1 Tax=Nostoc sp. WHI TaxID=2650611 RepID=UPI0018C6B5EC|nr:hypothetical protein [Nostoc sp. WHI]MBG1270115.1 hypothetical protein [Nostoc sp. WHI]